MYHTKRISTLLLSILLTATTCFAEDWPQFRGPNRDGKSAETGLLKKWPESGPKRLWSVDGLGIGFSSAAIADGFVYTTGMLAGEGFLFAYDLAGNLKWKESYGPEWTRSYKGTRTTPTIDGQRIYVFSGTGKMVCFSARMGERIWQVDTLEKFEAKNIQWGMTGSPLIDGPKVYCSPGGKKGAIVALDKMTGGTIWATPGLDEASTYSSPVLIEHGSNRLLVNLIQKSIMCVAADTGRLLWREPYETPSDTGSGTPIYKDGRLYVTSAVEREFKRGGVMLELSPAATAELCWSTATCMAPASMASPKAIGYASIGAVEKSCTKPPGTATKAQSSTPTACCTVTMKTPATWLWSRRLRKPLESLAPLESLRAPANIGPTRQYPTAGSTSATVTP